MPCAFGTPWLDHWDPPIGTGKGCEKCDAYKAKVYARLDARRETEPYTATEPSIA